MRSGWKPSGPYPGDLTTSQIRQLQTTVPQNDDDLWHYVSAILGINVPREKVCPDHDPPFQAFADAYFARVPISVWKASRGFGGKSFLLACLALTEQITLHASVSLLGGSGEQAQRVHAYLSGEDPNAHNKFWHSPLAPKWLLKTDPSKRESKTSKGGNIKALMASSTSVRGPHPQTSPG